MKPSFLYQFQYFKFPVAVFLAVYTALMLFMGIGMTSFFYTSSTVIESSGEDEPADEDFWDELEKELEQADEEEAEDESEVRSDVNGGEFSALIFIFVMGLVTFKEYLNFTTQNGISRKTFYAGRLASSAVMALGLSVACRILGFLLQGVITLFARDGVIVESHTLYEMMPYFTRAQGMSVVGLLLEEQLFNIAMFFMVFQFGNLITSLYYRLAKLGKWLLSLGTFAVLFVLLPYLNSVMHGAVLDAVGRWVNFVFALDTLNPYRVVLNLIVISGVFAGLGYLLVRRAPIKR